MRDASAGPKFGRSGREGGPPSVTGGRRGFSLQGDARAPRSRLRNETKGEARRKPSPAKRSLKPVLPDTSQCVRAAKFYLTVDQLSRRLLLSLSLCVFVSPSPSPSRVASVFPVGVYLNTEIRNRSGDTALATNNNCRALSAAVLLLGDNCLYLR